MEKRALVLAASLLLLASACGSSRRETVSAPEATRLAAQADAVAARLRAGDGCGAASLARRLRREIAATGLPAGARAAAAGLAAEIVCVPPAPATPQPAPAPAAALPQDEQPGKGHAHGRGHGKGHGKHGGGGGED